MNFQLPSGKSQVQTPVAFWFLNFFSVFDSNKKTDRNINENPGENDDNCSRKRRTLLFYYYL